MAKNTYIVLSCVEKLVKQNLDHSAELKLSTELVKNHESIKKYVYRRKLIAGFFCLGVVMFRECWQQTT